jgi:small GTP-binding protein
VSCTASPPLARRADATPCSEPTVFENYVHDIYIDNTHVELSLWDTAGQEEFDRLRSLSYDDTHAIMLCFSVDSPDSLENVETKWVSEIAENCPGVKLVLVALKCDLRKKDDDDEGTQPEKSLIQYDEGLKVAERIKALRYLGMSPQEPSQFFTNLHDRMLRHEEPRCKRGLHGSCACCPVRKDEQR